MSKPQTKRNKRLVEMRNKGCSYGELAKIFGIKRPTVFEIYNRDKEKYSCRKQLCTAPLDKC
ncbi:MAG: hypothetical protein WC788_03760 [Candidatus Paceibacterota bacterium]|jgi:DNA-binding CsgD family transcriptional regulator